MYRSAAVTIHVPNAVDIIERVTERLMRRHGDAVDDDVVRAIVIDSYRSYRHLDHPSAHARSLAAQLAADRLEALRRSLQKSDPGRAPSFLFICSGNAGRSQLAAAVMRAITRRPTVVMSGGETPAARILAPVIEALDEVGVPIFGEYPKPVTAEFVAAADHIIVLNCTDRLEVLDGHSFQTWGFSLENTSGKQGLRQTRDHIVAAVTTLARDNGLEPTTV